MVEALDIHVKGIVQGVGFRPFVYRLARRYLINGWVLNAIDGVFIHAEGESKLLDGFVMELHENPPAAAQVEEVELKEVPLEDFTTFEIRFSDQAAAQETTLVSPDLATCDDCAAELFDPANKRYRYPFINCTNCGPRFTIIDGLPYDRAKTSMREFPMCDACASEYADPLDRRFHAQPDACFTCGPSISFARLHKGADASEQTDGFNIVWGKTREESDAILAEAAQMLAQGQILAVKGLGGFHLACDANDAQAVAQLRQRKRREGKAFAVMMRSVQDVRRVCLVSAEEEKVLTSAARPIVLLRRRPQVEFAPGLIGDLPELGVMLPYTPVQHLLLHDFAETAAAQKAAQSDNNRLYENPPMLVMTSGNIHDEPIVIDDDQAYTQLADIADAIMGNNRGIRTRFDDSVVRVVQAGSAGTAVQMVRRARGYCPVPLSCAAEGPLVRNLCAEGDETPALFCTGPEQKNTFALARVATSGDADAPEGRTAEVFVSQHVGDLECAETFDAWLAAKARFQQLFKVTPTRIACDAHPEYLSSKWAAEQHAETGIPVMQVQHHHAHIASVLGEHGISEAVCGIAFDGTGYGTDGRIWGGEVLLCNRSAFERFANFAYVPMPGGAAAVKNPLRMAYGALWAFDLLEHPAAASALSQLGEQAQLCGQMIDRGLNTPLTSSAGRLFDAAAALLGICTAPTYEGEPAILLGAAALQATEQADHLAADQPQCEADLAAGQPQCEADAAADRYVISFVKNAASEDSTAQDTSVLLMDAAPVFRALLDDKAAGVPVPIIALRFHDAFVRAIVMAAELCRAAYGTSTVALSGGVFMNRYLIERSLALLEQAGFQVAVNRDLPPNDGCISFGQAVVALNAEQAL